MKFLHTILISLLLSGCVPPIVQATATSTTGVTQTLTANPPLTATHTSTLEPSDTGTPTQPTDDPVLVGAGDIAHCSSQGDEATADLLDNIPGTVFTTGDNVYRSGTVAEFANCYDPSWGRHKERTYPSPGNHDYGTGDGAGYYDYFGSAAGDPTKGYYSYNLGTWHIIVLNSNIPVDAGSPQEQWLREELAAHPVACTLAYWHHPRFSSGTQHGSNRSMRPLWQALYDFGADVVLAGHEHNYERFALQDPQGAADPTHGIRQFVIGSGGRSHYSFGSPISNSEVRNDDTYGVLRLTLHPGSYSWEFIPEAGKTFTDSGSAACVTP
ncbi:MAG TPA: metallophosphoesterase [Anaerolineales bacterium]